MTEIDFMQYLQKRSFEKCFDICMYSNLYFALHGKQLQSFVQLSIGSESTWVFDKCVGCKKFERMHLQNKCLRKIATSNRIGWTFFYQNVQFLETNFVTSNSTGWKRRSLALGLLAGSVTRHWRMKSFCCSSSSESMHFWMASAVTFEVRFEEMFLVQICHMWTYS